MASEGFYLRSLPTCVDDLVSLQVTDTIEDSAANFTWMDVP